MGERILVGRRKSLVRKYGFEYSFLLGADGRRKIYMDALYPHAVFICGMRGSGKSYTMGVIAEGLLEANPDVGLLIFDPIGIFWSMKFPNRVEEELELLGEWNLTPRGYPVKVLVPEGVEGKIPEETYDGVFSIPPSELTVEDWCLVFGIKRFSPMGMLLERVLEKAGEAYSIADILEILETDEELRDRKKGFRKETIRALVSRFRSAMNWGIFGEGVRLEDIIKPGKATVLDISFLEEGVGALVVGILARRILDARKIVTRQVSSASLLEKLEIEGESIPPTWIFVDEAHTLVPVGKTGPAKEPLIEYVKQGRRPGCGIVLASQQPSAVDSRLLSQVDILISHRLVLADDIKEVVRRFPSELPKDARSLLRKLETGEALLGDKEIAEAIRLKIRPRRSQHEGREIVRRVVVLDEKAVELMARKKIEALLQAGKKVSPELIFEVVRELNEKYGTSVDYRKLLDLAEESGGEEEVTDFSLTLRVPERNAKRIMERLGGPSFLPFARKGTVKSIKLVFLPIFEVVYLIHTKDGIERRKCYIDGISGEFIHWTGRDFVFSKGFRYFFDLDRHQARILYFLSRFGSTDAKKLSFGAKVPLPVLERVIEPLIEKGFVKKEKDLYSPAIPLDLPPDPKEPLLPSLEKLGTIPISGGEIREPRFDPKKVWEIIPGIWPGVTVGEVRIIYRPVWEGIVKTRKGELVVQIDGVSGKILEVGK